MYQGQSTEIIVKLLESEYESIGGLPASGILHPDVTFKFWRVGDTAFQTHTITAQDFLELGDGFYVLKIPGAILNRVGQFFIQLSGLLIQNYEQSFQVEPLHPSVLLAPNLCVVSGNIIDITGSPAMPGESIEFRIAQTPKASGGALVNTQRILTHPDAYGSFSVQLIRGAVIVVEIKRAGINYQFTVPDQSTASLLDLLPPI
jgi:hypothetical protein